MGFYCLPPTGNLQKQRLGEKGKMSCIQTLHSFGRMGVFCLRDSDKNLPSTLCQTNPRLHLKFLLLVFWKYHPLGKCRQLLSHPSSYSASFPIMVRLQGPFYSLYMQPTSCSLHAALSFIQSHQSSTCAPTLWLLAHWCIHEPDQTGLCSASPPCPATSMSGGACQLATWFPGPSSAHSYKAREEKKNCIFLPTLYLNLLDQNSECTGRVQVSGPSILFPSRLAGQNLPLLPYSRRE